MLPKVLPRLSHGRVLLRAFEERDVGVVQAASGDPLIPLITTVPSTNSRRDALAFIERQHDRLTTGSGYSFAVADSASDQAIGQIGLWLRDITEGRASAGYWIAAPYRRQGFAQAALQALTTWAFTLADVHRVHLYIEPSNEGSVRCAELCGYEREGLLRSWQQIGPERKDMLMYSRARVTT